MTENSPAKELLSIERNNVDAVLREEICNHISIIERMLREETDPPRVEGLCEALRHLYVASSKIEEAYLALILVEKKY